MKFWQLTSIASDNPGLISRVALTRTTWKRYELLASNFSNLVKAQDRAMLDSIVDTDFVIAVLGEIQKNLYLSSDNWLRSWQLDPDDQVVSILDAFIRYGPDIVEDVFERGSVEVY